MTIQLLPEHFYQEAEWASRIQKGSQTHVQKDWTINRFINKQKLPGSSWIVFWVVFCSMACYSLLSQLFENEGGKKNFCALFPKNISYPGVNSQLSGT